jgi:ABC-type multidrug transport system fused ATPase/permease subunit
MENSNVVEQDAHEELMARRGHYWRLLRSQLQP